MSHFSVLVIGDKVEEQLAPFHEFECTGIDDQYVVEVDEMGDLLAQYAAGKRNMYRDPEGVLHSPYEDRFYREFTPEELEKFNSYPPMGSGCGNGIVWASQDWGDGKGYRAKVHFCPEGFEKVEAPYLEVMSFLEFVEYQTSEDYTVRSEAEIDLKGKHKYGYTLVENGEVTRVVRRTNPNNKWDWYQVGGRWTGFFKLKPGAVGEAGEPGLGTGRCEAGYADVALKGNIDFEGMVTKHVEEQLGYYRKFHAVVNGRDLPRWEEIVVKHGDDIEAARTEFYDNEVVKALREADFFMDLERYQVEEAEFVHKAKRKAVATFAVIKDGVWYEKGSMGMFGCVSDEKDPEAWLEQFYALLQELPDETLLTVVDCHI